MPVLINTIYKQKKCKNPPSVVSVSVCSDTYFLVQKERFGMDLIYNMA